MSWPVTFRTVHRSTISVLYLRALILRHSPTFTTAISGSEKPPQWLHTARFVTTDYRAMLSVCTTFPRAGERNIKVEDFVDLCVGIWETSGAIGDHAGWIMDVSLIISSLFIIPYGLTDLVVGHPTYIQLVPRATTHDTIATRLGGYHASQAYTAIIHTSRW